jgi:hypothetical protein
MLLTGEHRRYSRPKIPEQTASGAAAFLRAVAAVGVAQIPNFGRIIGNFRPNGGFWPLEGAETPPNIRGLARFSRGSKLGNHNTKLGMGFVDIANGNPRNARRCKRPLIAQWFLAEAF